MPSLKITDTAILRQMKVGTFYTDTAVKRLQLYKSQNGGSWYFRTLAGGRKKFGQYPQIDIDDARRIAIQMGDKFDLGEEITSQQINSSGGQTKIASVKDAHVDMVNAKRPVWSAGTMRTNMGYWRNHIDPKFSQRALSSITTGELTKWINSFESLNQRNTLRSYFSQIFRHAIQVEMCVENPAHRLPISDVIVEKEFFSKDEAIKLVEALQEMESMAAKAILMCLYTGQRPSQTKALRWEMINEKVNGDVEMRVPAAATKHKRVVNVLLNPNAKILLQSQKQKYGKGEFVFPSPYGGHIKKLNKVFRNACNKAEVRLLSEGKLRHTFVNLHIDKVPIDELSYYIGHSTVATTQKAYAEMTVEKSRGISEADLF